MSNIRFELHLHDAAFIILQVGEFYYTPNDTTVQFRLSSIKDNNNKSTVGKGMGRRSLSNIDRAEKIRKALRYTKIPVLRNRKRTVRVNSLSLFAIYL